MSNNKGITAIQLIGWDNITYYHMAKTAGTSIRSWLTLHKNPHSNIITLPNDQTITELKTQYYIPYSFTVVRNPWDRMVSLWTYGMNRNWNFTDFLPITDTKPNFEQFISALTLLPNDYINIVSPMTQLIDNNIDVILRFEHLHEDFKIIQQVMNCVEPLQKIKTSTRSDYKDYYNDTGRNIIAQLFEQDIDQWKYTY